MEPINNKRDSLSSCKTTASTIPGSFDDEETEDDHLGRGVECLTAEVISWKALSKVIRPAFLQSVKSCLDCQPPLNARFAARHVAKWRDKKMCDGQIGTDEIRDGWKVRQALAALVPPKTVNTYFMDLVKGGKFRELDVFFRVSKIDPSIHISRRFSEILNYTDEHERSALRVAIDNRDVEMCGLLLKYEISIGDCLFHAIQQNFVEGAEAILRHDNCRRVNIFGENNYFPVGITPMIFAAHCNNYDMLKLLHKYKHDLEQSVECVQGTEMCWEAANKRRMLCRAKSTPAYITLWTETSHEDPMKYCINRLDEIRAYSELESECSEVYDQMEKDVENYMCALLDQVRSSFELANLFKFDYDRFDHTKRAIASLQEGTRARSDIGSMLELLDTASDKHLVKFVTHYNSQLTLTYLRYRNMYFLRRMNIFKRTFLGAIGGLLFPLLSIFSLISPSSRLGSLLALPIVSFSCHVMSDLVFISILLANVLTKSLEMDYLGAPPTIYEWLLILWVLGKWWQELQECINRGLKTYVCDWWNYNDILQLSLFSISFALRTYDHIRYSSWTKRVHRDQWDEYEPRLISEALLAWAYVFAFLRIFSLVRAAKVLGPLQVSLSKMTEDTVQFFCIFILVIMSFALGLSELYWFYGTTPGKRLVCVAANSTGETCKSTPVLFTSIGNSLSSLFYAIFGIIDINMLHLSGKHRVIEAVGRSLVAVYHVVAIIVLINMLIAMMAKSYEEISSNGENEWKFHRTAMWIRFIRREIGRPPPMNLIPHLQRHVSRVASWWRDTRQERLCGEKGKAFLDPCGLRNKRSMEVMRRLVQRYKYTKLLKKENGAHSD